MILLDTHIFIWLVNGDEKLTEKYMKIISEEKNKYLSVVSCWEISLLLTKGRVNIRHPFTDWIQNALKAYDIDVINLDLDIILAYHKLNGFHNDPPDKLIASTSICKGIPLMTFDKKLIEYKGINITQI